MCVPTVHAIGITETTFPTFWHSFTSGFPQKDCYHFCHGPLVRVPQECSLINKHIKLPGKVKNKYANQSHRIAWSWGAGYIAHATEVNLQKDCHSMADRKVEVLLPWPLVFKSKGLNEAFGLCMSKKNHGEIKKRQIFFYRLTPLMTI